MANWRQFSTMLPGIVLGISFFSGLQPLAHSETVTAVSFQTGDGWRIAGTLYLPDNLSGETIPAVVLLTEPGWVDRSIYDNYLSRKLAKSGMAALSIDMRGTGGSADGKEFDELSPEELGRLQLDVSGAIKFLSARKGIDAQRIAIVGSGVTANQAIGEAVQNPAVQALVLISGELSPASMDLLKSRVEIPVLFVAGKKDKKSLQQMAVAYSLSENDDSDLALAVGHGTVMFSHTAGLEEQVVQWLGHNLQGLGREVPVTFQSSDGWTLHGVMRIPEGAAASSKMPAVVLNHGAKHDQQTYYHLAREAAKKGLVTLRFDWRGKGESINDGKGVYGVNLSPQDEEKIHLDIKAAVDFLAAQKQVDAARIGMVAATLSCVQALEASLGDPRIKTLVLLTALEPTPQAKQYLTTSDAPILAVASREDNNYQRGNLADSTRQIYELSKSKHSQLLLYDDAGRGSEMFKVKRELQPMVLRWLTEKLAK